MKLENVIGEAEGVAIGHSDPIANLGFNLLALWAKTKTALGEYHGNCTST